MINDAYPDANFDDICAIQTQARSVMEVFSFLINPHRDTSVNIMSINICFLCKIIERCIDRQRRIA